MQPVTAALLLGSFMSGGAAASAGLVGVNLVFECAQCTPAVADQFTGVAGPADYSLNFDDYTWNEVDVEASTITIKSFVEGMTRSPLVFRLTWSPAAFRLQGAAISPLSSYETGYSWGPGELVVDMGDRYFLPHQFITFDLTAAPVPEPGRWQLILLGSVLLVFCPVSFWH